MHISVIIPTYRRASLLKETIKSVSAQTWTYAESFGTLSHPRVPRTMPTM